jgi:GT2 family glycosyltransferase
VKVLAVIVTRDRQKLLRHSLAAVRDQSRPVDGLVVVDNASSDGTAAMLRREFPTASVLALEENVGGAGGFYEGIRQAYAEGADWMWLMDDDSIPRRDALEELLAVVGDPPDGVRPAVLCSRVEWSDGTAHPMNIPTIRRRDLGLLATSARRGLLPLRAATFVSLALAREAVEHHGMPIKDYFWQVDDIEYTARILRSAMGYYVPGSVVEHRTVAKRPMNVGDERFYFSLRNSLFMVRGDAWEPREKPALAWAVLRSVGEYLKTKRLSNASLRTLVRATRAGLRPPPA